jgi:hypothetical protein
MNHKVIFSLKLMFDHKLSQIEENAKYKNEELWTNFVSLYDEIQREILARQPQFQKKTKNIKSTEKQEE